MPTTTDTLSVCTVGFEGEDHHVLPPDINVVPPNMSRRFIDYPAPLLVHPRVFGLYNFAKLPEHHEYGAIVLTNNEGLTLHRQLPYYVYGIVPWGNWDAVRRLLCPYQTKLDRLNKTLRRELAEAEQSRASLNLTNASRQIEALTTAFVELRNHLGSCNVCRLVNARLIERERLKK